MPAAHVLPRARPPRWRRRLTLLMRTRGAVALAEAGTLLLMAAMMAITWLIIANNGHSQRSLSPPVVALLLVANLVPAMGLMVLVARRIARGRAERSPLGRRGRLHVRLVALFSVLAALPTLLVVIFASLLFQYGVEFWFSDRARVVLSNADRVAQTYVQEHKVGLGDDHVAMAGDLLNALSNASTDDPRWDKYFASQVFFRRLDQAAMIQLMPDGSERLIWGANLDRRPLEARLPKALILTLNDGKPHVRVLTARLESAMRFDAATRTYLYISRLADPLVLAQAARANSALSDYQSYADRGRTLQLQFNAALFAISLLIVGIAIWIALNMADRLVRPIGDLVGAARRVAGGDLAARVAIAVEQDEVGTLATAFNRMTRRLQEQTGALESRRALTEAVVAGVSAGVISVDDTHAIGMINRPAQTLLGTAGSPIGAPLTNVAPELAQLLESGEREAVVQLAADGDVRTLAVRIVRAEGATVLTFDDITQQLADQRRAAWSDVARRIAHEIKNPLTPIQLAAERLQRRYGKQVESDDGTFDRLVSTIVRQVGDIRRMIDEFSGFARMPKPEFRRENLVEVARQTLFLHEVAHPGIAFEFEATVPPPHMVCDRRQIGQALTNIVKNAAEAVEARVGEKGGGQIAMRVVQEGEQLSIIVADDGIGLPAERQRLTEPYMTTRAKGTGLGLAIVEKIVEEHMGALSFADRAGGGSIVRLDFTPAALAHLEQTERDPLPQSELVAVRSR